MSRFGLDDAMADRLLAGSVAPEDAPPGYAALAAAIQAARQPATADEQAAPPAVIAAIAATIRANPMGVPDIARRQRLRGRFATKVAAATSVFVLAGTGAAAAAGALPPGIQRTVADAADHIGVSIPKPNQGHTPGNGHAAVNTLTPQSPELYGLCQAFGAPTSTTSHRGKDESVAYQRLVTLAHGQTVSDYCKPILAQGPNGSANSNFSPSHPTPAPHSPPSNQPDHQSTGAPGTPSGNGPVAGHGNAPNGTANGHDTDHSDGSGSGHGAGATHSP
jgi:hypothetical protein